MMMSFKVQDLAADWSMRLSEQNFLHLSSESFRSWLSYWSSDIGSLVPFVATVWSAASCTAACPPSSGESWKPTSQAFCLSYLLSAKEYFWHHSKMTGINWKMFPGCKWDATKENYRRVVCEKAPHRHKYSLYQHQSAEPTKCSRLEEFNTGPLRIWKVGCVQVSPTWH